MRLSPISSGLTAVWDLPAAHRKVCSTQYARRGPPWLTDLFAAILFLALSVGLVLHPHATGQGMPGDLADQRFNLSMLATADRPSIGARRDMPVMRSARASANASKNVSFAG